MEKLFWAVVENDLLQIPEHIKDAFNSNGYGNPLSFKTVGDDDINEVEMSMRNVNPSFKFQPGDKKLIKTISTHVKEIVDDNGLNAGVAHFTNSKSSVNDVEVTHKTREHSLLEKLLLTTEKNGRAKNEHGYRYDPEIKLYAAYLRRIAGPLAYETIQKNLPSALPSLVSTNRYINISGCQITEGILRKHELRNYLDERNLDPAVCISEDGTRINGRVQYDAKSNQIVGFVLPISSENGLPIPSVFPATSAETIFEHFSNGHVTTFMNVVMAQPIANVPPFCLMIFGSDNKYTTKNVCQRWQYIEKELAEVGIKVLVFSSDSDSRYNCAMRKLTELGKESKFEWFSSNQNIDCPLYVQDSIHIATKLRNFLLKTGYCAKSVPFGKYFIRLNHLYEIITKFPKDRHQLTPSTLNPTDRHNFASVLRICDPKVTALLNDYVQDSHGTAQYLQMLRDIIDSYMDPNLAPLQRIRKIWYSLFLIRIWRNSIVFEKKFTLKNNFKSSNCYACIELNAHALVKCLLHLQRINKPEYLMPHLFNSQSCEGIFNQFRSFTTTYSTVTNCTLKEAINRISKIQFQNVIVHTTSTDFVYPRAKNHVSTTDQHTLPRMDQIVNEIHFCRKLAIVTAKKLGLISTKVHKELTLSCGIRPMHEQKLKSKCVSSQPKQHNHFDLYKFKLSDFKNIQLKNYAEKVSPDKIELTSPYAKVPLTSDKWIVVKKTSLCWLLGTECRKMSSDRLLRVKYSMSRPVTAKSKQKPKFKQNKVYLHSVLHSKKEKTNKQRKL